MSVKPKTSDPTAMIREGFFEPERVFPSPKESILEGNLDDKAFEMLELIVWIFWIAQHEQPLQRGIGWSTLQRWYYVGDSQPARHRIYAAMAFLAAEGYVREGPESKMAWTTHPSLHSDFVFPTERAFKVVDRRQAPLVQKAWREIAQRNGGLAALVAGIVSLLISASYNGIQRIFQI